jgi:hypothetical protein
VRRRLGGLPSCADDGQMVEDEQAAGQDGFSRPHADGLASEVVASTRCIRGLENPRGRAPRLGRGRASQLRRRLAGPSETGSLSWFSRLDHPPLPRPVASGCLCSAPGADGG